MLNHIFKGILLKKIYLGHVGTFKIMDYIFIKLYSFRNNPSRTDTVGEHAPTAPVVSQVKTDLNKLTNLLTLSLMLSPALLFQHFHCTDI